MTFDEYQKAAHATSKNTSIGGDKLIYPVLGMGDEVGEVLGKVKKVYRDKDGSMEAQDKYAIAQELGDVLWYLSETSFQLGFDLSLVAALNIEKLADRADRGVIGGSGDNR